MLDLEKERAFVDAAIKPGLAFSTVEAAQNLEKKRTLGAEAARQRSAPIHPARSAAHGAALRPDRRLDERHIERPPEPLRIPAAKEGYSLNETGER